MKHFVFTLLWLFCHASGLWADSWPNLKYDSAGDGNNPSAALTLPLTQAWYYAPGGLFGNFQLSSPIVDDQNHSYFASSLGALYAFNNNPSGSQTTLWTFQTKAPIYSTPAFATLSGNRLVFVGSTDGNLYAINAANGSQVWLANLGNAIYSSPIIVTMSGTAVLLCGSNDGNLHALNAADGAPLWTFTTNHYISAAPVYDSVNNLLYVVSQDGYLYALVPSLNSVSLSWKQNVGSTIASPAVANGIVYNLSKDATLTAWNASGGTVFTVSNLNNNALASPAVLRGSGQSTIYIGLADGTVLAENYPDGGSVSQLWRRPCTPQSEARSLFPTE